MFISQETFLKKLSGDMFHQSKEVNQEFKKEINSRMGNWKLNGRKGQLVNIIVFESDFLKM